MKYDCDIYKRNFSKIEDLYDKNQIGVYFLFDQLRGTLLYVGKSTRLRKRIYNHINNFDRLDYLTYHECKYSILFKIIYCSKEELDEVEKYFIEKYHPEMNGANNSKATNTYDEWFSNKLLMYEYKKELLKERGIV